MVSNIDISLSAEPREKLGAQVINLREQGLLPAVVYGSKTKNIALTLNSQEFEGVFKDAGESSLINLKIKGEKGDLIVLVHDIQKDPLSGKIIHVDFYSPDLKKAVKTLIPLRFEGESPAIKSLGGTLIKNFHELEVKSLPTNIPHEIIVNIDSLEELGSEIFIKDLTVPEGAEILKDPKELVALVAAPTRVEEELEKPIEEKVEEIEGVVKEGEETEEEKDQDKKEEPKDEEEKDK
ncbi:MAG: 50S ribosomal protein L25 [Patescibacteria group bacterium]|nr:50S ribosomal protein L25 [Patescibacteria group bacterium]